MKKLTMNPMLRILLLLSLILPLSTAVAAEPFILAAKVTDGDGKPVEGAEVFAYSSPRTRRPADFISPRTGRDGTCRLALQPGKYWVVARVKKGESFGPLLPGDRHSGDPIEVEAGAGGAAEVGFTVADIREAARAREKGRTDAFRLAGKVVDQGGKPVANATVFAHRERAFSGMPDAVSAWTGPDGEYLLFLPPGRWFLGAATDFPPPGMTASAEVTLPEGGGRRRVDVRINGAL